MNRRGLQPLGVVVSFSRLLKSFHLLPLRNQFTERIIHYQISLPRPAYLTCSRPRRKPCISSAWLPHLRYACNPMPEDSPCRSLSPPRCVPHLHSSCAERRWRQGGAPSAKREVGHGVQRRRTAGKTWKALRDLKKSLRNRKKTSLPEKFACKTFKFRL